MGKEYFELLAKYNQKANEKMNDSIETLSEEEWNRAFAGFYKSVHELCSHVFIADYTKINSLRGTANFKSLPDDYFNRTYRFEEVLFSTINEYLVKRAELDALIVNCTREMTNDDLAKTIKFASSKGVPLEKRMDVLLLHTFNHETHCRGMISLYLEMLGKENDFSGLYGYV
jgi:uncharacterized damage-inducible protein DinB